MNRAVVVMGKLPRAGRVKTRLAKAIGPERAAELYRAFLLDTFALVDAALPEVSFARVFACALDPNEPLSFASQLAPPGWRVAEQRGADLGERIEAARAITRADQVVILGSDSPGTPRARIVSAFEALDRGADAVFGPTEDGGYYLIALPGPRPALLRNIPWSTPEVMEATRRAGAQAKLQLAELPLGWDIDEAEDLARILTSGEPMVHTRFATVGPQTFLS